VHSVPVDEAAAAIGCRIDELDLASLGAEVTAVRRRGIRGADPSGDMVLQAGDVVVLRGVPEALELAEVRLLQR
jgi:CPA2 family monovalent cation:H+ antiporter-2